MTKLTDHFTLEELTFSAVAARRGIPNEPGSVELANLTRLAEFLERVRIRLNYNAIFVHSAYRSPEVNELVSGVATSAHLKGLAGDIESPGYGAPFAVADAIRTNPALMAEIDQLILEYGWVHVGLADTGRAPRGELLTKRSAAAPYENGLNV